MKYLNIVLFFRLSNKWRNNSDGQTDDDEVIKKRKKRYVVEEIHNYV